MRGFRMKNIRITDFEEYENAKYGKDDNDFENNNSAIGGSTIKRFIRMDNKIFRPLLKAKLKDNSYVTYIDDFIQENVDNKGNIPLKYISCLLKKERSILTTNDNIKKDVWGSRFANFFGVPTVYNDIVQLDYETYLVSVDFVKSGQEVSACSNTYDAVRVDDLSLFKDWEEFLKVKVGGVFAYSKASERGSDSHQKDTKDKFVRDFVPHYMLRNMLLDDSDFKPRNINYITEIKDGVKNISLAPANDFEFAMSYRRRDLMRENMQENMEYLYENYPEETTKFVDNIKKKLFKNNQLNSSKIRKIFEEVEKDKEYFSFLEERLLTNIDAMVQQFDSVKEKRDKQVDLVG